MKLIEVCRYLSETEVKKTRAEKRYADELKSKEQKEAEVVLLNE